MQPLNLNQSLSKYKLPAQCIIGIKLKLRPGQNVCSGCAARGYLYHPNPKWSIDALRTLQVSSGQRGRTEGLP